MERPAVHMEPVHVRGILAKFHQTVELEKSTRAMVEHAIQNHAKPKLVRLLDELIKIPERSKHRVNFKIIDRMVAVIRIALENRAKVNGIHAQRRNVIKLFANASEVSAKHVFTGRESIPIHKLSDRFVLCTTAKAVRKNLIENSVLSPIGECHDLVGSRK